jgi:hypothetical protein
MTTEESLQELEKKAFHLLVHAAAAASREGLSLCAEAPRSGASESPMAAILEQSRAASDGGAGIREHCEHQ